MENDFRIFNRNPVYLKVFIVEPILVSCIDKTLFADIYTYVQRVSPNITKSEVKEHLFYLVSSSFIDYNGKNKTYYISQNGIDLLDIVYSQRNIREVDYSSLTLKVG
ncbi:MAG: hypothetical protein AB7V56_10675 [Candidatus Nitrosocosmicus sp.]|jgi:hypothetical protein|uniref:hypothetical protein n=1 Tax=Candidatus Nitrosocosmicus agrestis TaxID=2563600 RepID=UPI00122DCF7F|nr:hypothetical protein [Candidatus Nitrosocosmicus sp. SS]KAA2282980.1 hypothetical protein F1Z66_04780 [Candidatus Nitrosocosmicus sp. SS]KAF0869183.1 hypothetical protein E5N71_07060 [Candidatus Nitrosocosmicus sp. SS]MDR4489447.1 hypothetical protein [Candidatus Nitrosocosmicus sp.]